MSNVIDSKDVNIQSIVENISKLTLLEVSDLIKSLCYTLNLPDPLSMPVAAVANNANNDGTDSSSNDTTPIEYNLKYYGLENADKAGLPIIKLVRTICQEQGHTDTNLVSIKKKVEGANEDNPLILASNIEKDVYERYKKDLLEQGAKLDIK